jgi:ArsR family transcriptional regulator
MESRAGKWCYNSQNNEMDLARSVEAHKALAHPARQRLVAMLRDGELCVCQLITVLELAASTVSAHLTELKRPGLLLETKKGRFVMYRWSEEPAAKGLLSDLATRIARDPQVVADAKLVRSLRRVGVEELCRVDRDLSRVGIRRPSRDGVGTDALGRH